MNIRILFASCCLGLVQTVRAEQVVFSEVMYQPPVGKPEFVEVWNITNTPLDMANWRFNDGIAFTFPDFNAGSSQAHFLKGLERIIVSAAGDAATRSAYPAIPAGVRIFGPWDALTSLDNGGERVTLKDKNGVVMTTVNYGDEGRWPISPDGTGHSLVLADENRAIDDWRVWRASTNNGGSAGLADPAPPATGLALNEIHFRNADGHVDWIEVRNDSLTTTQSAAVLFVASKLDFSDKIALSGSVTPGAVASFNVDFATDNNGDVRIYLIDASNNVRSAKKLRRKAGRDAWQVFPAGSGEWFNDVADTRDAQNNPARNVDIVINEIMADPPSNERDGEFVELHNRGASPVDVGGWKLDNAVKFTIPPGTTIAAGGWLVIAANSAHLNAAYAGLAAIGNWSGSLGNGGDLLRLEDANSNLANQVDYRFGGEWPELAGGSGSSLELVNPNADNTLGGAWADSDESAKSSFQPVTIDGGTYRDLTINYTQSSVVYPINDDEIRLWIPGDGHLILRNIVLRPTSGGSNLFVNPNVTTLANNNVDGWQSSGTHWGCFHDAEGVHLVADGHGDNKINHMQKDAPGMLASTAYTLAFEARWVSGKPRIVAQSWDMSWGGVALVPIPANLGTPGAANSRLLAAAPPQVTGGLHSPAVPVPGQTMTITARVSSAAALTGVSLKHRLDNINANAAWNTTAMNDSGTGGDAVAGDGIFTAQIVPASFAGYGSAGAIVQFYVEAAATSGLTGQFPRGGANLPGMWVVDSNVAATDLRRVRVVMSAYWGDALDTPAPPLTTTPPGIGEPATGGGSAKFNYKFPRFSNHYFPCTFIHNDGAIYYGCTVRKTGSPFTRGTASSLDRARMTLPGDRPFRGKGKLYWDNDASGGSMLHNRIHRYWLYLLGVPGNQNEVCRIAKNNTAYTVRETSEVFDKDMLDRIWDHGSEGQFFEMDDKFQIGDDGATRFTNANGTFDYDPANSPGAENPVSYHNNFVPKSREWEYDYGTLIEWCRQLETNTAITQESLERMADTQAMAAYAAVRGYTADWDNITMSRGKNGFFYNRATDHKWMFLHWDSDNAFQTTRINDAVVGTLTNVGTTSPGYFSKPFVRRYVNYYLNEMITTYSAGGARIGAWITAEENASASYAMPATYAAWPTTLATSGTAQTRHQVIQTFIGATSLGAAFATTSPANNSSTAADTATIAGTAPSSAFSVICVGHPEAVLTWTSTNATNTSPWSLAGVQLRNGANVLTLRMLSVTGAQVGADSALTINKTTDALPVVVVASEPSSQNVALGEVLNIDAIGSYDPEGTALTFGFAVSPASGFTMTSPTAASRNLTFSVPGTYTVTIQATDGVSQVGTATRIFTVYNASDFDSFGDKLLAAYTVANTELRDNSSPATWYSLNETSGSLVVQLTAITTFPLRQTTPAFPRITRTLPATADFVLQTNFNFETRQFGSFFTGLYAETVESGVTVRYAFGLENGTVLKVWRASGAANYAQVGTLAYAGGDLTLRLHRSGATLNFQRRVNGAWTNVLAQNIGAASTATNGGLFASSGAVNTATIAPGQSLRVAFDYLLLADPGNSTDLVGSLRITEIMYNPSGAGGVEFIELKNIGLNPINLSGAYFADGNPFSSRFTFGNLTLQPGRYCVVTNNTAAFTTLYGTGATIAGQSTGSLNNDGERIELKDVDGNPIHDFNYSDLAPWPLAGDGLGSSIEVLVADPALYGLGTNWRASQELGGSPGYLGFATDTDGDGIADSIELAFGSDPNNAASVPSVPATARNALGEVTLTFASETGRTFTVQYRDDLLTGTWQTLATVTATGPTASYIDTTAGAQRFYRIATQFP